MGDETLDAFTEVKPSNWKKNRNKSTTPIPTYSPTTEWPTYSPTTAEDLADWLKKKQKYLKNRDKVPDSVWESDEASVGKKKLAWLEKQKDKKKSDNDSNTEKEEVSNSDQQQQEEEGTNPTPTPTYYDPAVIPTRKQKQLKKQAKLEAQEQNTTDNEASGSVAPSADPTVFDTPVSSNLSSSSTPSISDIPTVQVPTKKQKKIAEKQAEEEMSRATDGRYSGGSREPPKSRPKPTVADTKGNETDAILEVDTKGNETDATLGDDTKGNETNATFEEESEELEPAAQETQDESGPEILETTEEPKKKKNDNGSASDVSNSNKKKSTTSEKVSLILTQEDLQEKQAATRDAPKPTRAPVEPTKTIKVNFTFSHNRAKKRVTPAPTPVVTSSEPTYVLFPTITPTDELSPTYVPTDVPTADWTWAPSLNKDRSNSREESLFDKRTCPSDTNLFFESELRSAEQTSESVFFTYGIQTNEDGDIEEAVENIQLWLLEDVARKLLHCSTNAIDFGEKDGQGILSSVYYSKDDRQYAKQCKPTTSESDMCAIVSSTLRFDAVDQEMKVRPKVLAVISNQLEGGFDERLEEANIMDLAYLGPELGYYQPPDKFGVKDTHASGSSIPISAYAAIGVALFAVFALLLCLAMGYKLRKERRRPSSSPMASSYRDVSSQHEESYSFTPSGSNRSLYR